MEDQRDMVEAARVELENAELELPPTAAPKTVGRQVHARDLDSVFRSAPIPALLEALSARYSEEFGEDIADVVGRRTMQGFDLLHAANAELQESRREIKEQVEADRKAAVQLHKAINLQGVQSGDKRERDGHVDRSGDERMNRDEGVHDAAYDEDYPEFQEPARRKKGKGREAPTTTSSASVEPSAFPLGPLATAPRAAADTGARQARDRSPRRPLASGTPAAAMESGSLQRSPLKEAQEHIPQIPSTATLSGTVQQIEETEVVPQMPPPTATVTAEEPETPYLDSLPSTPRVDATQTEEPETPNNFEELPPSAQPMEQDDHQAPGASAAQDGAGAAGLGDSN